ncbi:hypothetical protein ciss_22340 [Carboxydothermus islandicus]|uniref:Uncharacterized protein n=1 Tax=Carboxydothermus islandicus TaxID=661089 RepID=A0A1L8D5E7_9THEO|nr:hypothetical protein [Carboxydothermus islandicus]GAV26301.1 hypothetical protein ciss_22340 [Carboxydothermus islandicus]
MLAFLLILAIFLFFLMKNKRGLRSEFSLGSSIKQLLTGAGAIYLSLDAILKFLGIKIPEKIVIGDVALKPLPAVSLFLALLEPVGEGIVSALRRACRQRNN